MTDDRDKTWAEKIPLATCRCGHTNTIHAGGIGACSLRGCVCGEFKERIASAEPPLSAFQEVKRVMERKED